MLKTVLSPFSDKMYAVLRIVSGGLLLLSGSQSVFGLFGQSAMGFADSRQVWIGKCIEVVGGLAIALGLFTRCAAFVCSGMMAVAYWQFHVFGPHSPAGYQKFIPTNNHGMPAVLLCFVYLYIACKGGGPWSIDAKREAAKPS